MSDQASDLSSDRAQFTTPRLIPVTLTGGAVLAVVIAEMRDRVAAASAAEPVSFCGLCHVDWRPAAALLIIGVLVAFAAYTVSFVKPVEGDDE